MQIEHKKLYKVYKYDMHFTDRSRNKNKWFAQAQRTYQKQSPDEQFIALLLKLRCKPQRRSCFLTASPGRELHTESCAPTTRENTASTSLLHRLIPERVTRQD